MNKKNKTTIQHTTRTRTLNCARARDYVFIQNVQYRKRV